MSGADRVFSSGMRFYPVIYLILWFLQPSFAAQPLNPDTTEVIDKKKLTIALAGMGTAYAITWIGLNEAWYKDAGRTSFHFFDDSPQWNQIDKLGHVYNAYQISRIGKEVFAWTGMNPKKSAIWGSVLSQALMIPIEVLDGYSPDFGFSWSDVVANLAGTTLFLSQELIWEKQKFKLKMSFHPTSYAELRPEVLGNGFAQQLLKDYNGHTFWLSCDVHGLSDKTRFWPRWLNPAFGYGADGMVYGRDHENELNGFKSYRQFYFSIDPDLSYINTRRKGIRVLLFFVDMIKLPAPALEYNSLNKWVFHWFYF